MWVLRFRCSTNRWLPTPKSEWSFGCILLMWSMIARPEELVDSLAGFNPQSIFSLLVMRTCIFLMAKRTYGNATTGSMGFITSRSNRRKSYPSLSEITLPPGIMVTKSTHLNKDLVQLHLRHRLPQA